MSKLIKNYQLEVVVCGTSKKVLADSIVLLQSKKNSILLRADYVLNEKKYRIDNILEGSYELIVKREGYDEVLKNITIKENKTIVEVQLTPTNVKQIRIGHEVVDFVSYPDKIGVFTNLNSIEDLLEFRKLINQEEHDDLVRSKKVTDNNSLILSDFDYLVPPLPRDYSRGRLNPCYKQLLKCKYFQTPTTTTPFKIPFSPLYSTALMYG